MDNDKTDGWRADVRWGSTHWGSYAQPEIRLARPGRDKIEWIEPSPDHDSGLVHCARGRTDDTTLDPPFPAILSLREEQMFAVHEGLCRYFGVGDRAVEQQLRDDLLVERRRVDEFLAKRPPVVIVKGDVEVGHPGV